MDLLVLMLQLQLLRDKVIMNKLIILCFSVLVAVGVSGCKGSANLNEVVVANNYVKNTSSYQKQGSAVSLVNSQVNIATSGVQYAVDLVIDSQYSSGDMQVNISTSKGLYIMDGSTEISQSLTKGSITLPYIVTASEVGRYYIYANIQTESNGVKSFRSLTLIVQVGEDTTLQTKASDSTVKTFGDVVPMTASEEIIQ